MTISLRLGVTGTYGSYWQAVALVRLAPAQKTSQSTPPSMQTTGSPLSVEPTVTPEIPWSKASRDWSAYLSGTGF